MSAAIVVVVLLTVLLLMGAAYYAYRRWTQKQQRNRFLLWADTNMSRQSYAHSSTDSISSFYSMGA